MREFINLNAISQIRLFDEKVSNVFKYYPPEPIGVWKFKSIRPGYFSNKKFYNNHKRLTYNYDTAEELMADNRHYKVVGVVVYDRARIEIQIGDETKVLYFESDEALSEYSRNLIKECKEAGVPVSTL